LIYSCHGNTILCGLTSLIPKPKMKWVSLPHGQVLYVVWSKGIILPVIVDIAKCLTTASTKFYFTASHSYINYNYIKNPVAQGLYSIVTKHVHDQKDQPITCTAS